MKPKDKLANLVIKLQQNKKSKLKSFDTALLSLGVHQQEDRPKNSKSCAVEK